MWPKRWKYGILCSTPRYVFCSCGESPDRVSFTLCFYLSVGRKNSTNGSVAGFRMCLRTHTRTHTCHDCVIIRHQVWTGSGVWFQTLSRWRKEEMTRSLGLLMLEKVAALTAEPQSIKPLKFNESLLCFQRTDGHPSHPGVPDDSVPQEALQWLFASNCDHAPALQRAQWQNYGGQGGGKTCSLFYFEFSSLDRFEMVFFLKKNLFHRINYVNKETCWCFSSASILRPLGWFSPQTTKLKCWRERRVERHAAQWRNSWRKCCHLAQNWASAKTRCSGSSSSRTLR